MGTSECQLLLCLVWWLLSVSFPQMPQVHSAICKDNGEGEGVAEVVSGEGVGRRCWAKVLGEGVGDAWILPSQ